MSLIKKALDHRQIILTFTVLIFLFGLIALLTMPRREDPKFNVRQGLIIVAHPGSTPTEINRQVITKIEDVLFSYQEVRKDKTYSNARHGVAYMVVELESFVTDADLFWSKLQHRLNALRLTSLPKGVVGPVVESDFGDTIALLISFQSDKRSERELNGYIDLLSNDLRSMRSLSKVRRINTEEESVIVSLDSRKLAQYKFLVPDILSTLALDNVQLPSGNLKVNGEDLIILKPQGITDINELASTSIGVGPLGETVALEDVATIRRGTNDPTQYIRTNGKASVLVSLEMQNGFNIVDFGKEIQEKIESFRENIPPDIEIIEIVDQPGNVAESVNDFIREFFTAIASVIVIIMLLLPFRVALIAATAIPVTVAFTFAIMNGVNIQLQQVSLASLIVVLGLLVDDAVIIADNYVEKLDEGVDRYTAAWTSASELTIPMFTAGMTIVGSFFPLLFLSGYVGEFISSLPITVAIAINASFVVAMFLTPFMCEKFIKQGLKKDEGKKKRFSFLDGLQQFFDRSLALAFEFPKITFTVSLLFILAGAAMFPFLDQKLFPAAERNQFVVELRAKEGTSLDAMDNFARIAESKIKEDSRLESYATFVGSSAPRFYYNYTPRFPQTNFAQLLINTETIEQTDEWVEELESTLPYEILNCEVHVKKMQQGPSMEAPIEIRISGMDQLQIESIAGDILNIFHTNIPNTQVALDGYEYQSDLKVDLDKLTQEKLGVSSSDIALQIAIAYDGIALGNMWEGKTAIPIILKDENLNKQSVSELQEFYVYSKLTGQSFPLSQIGEINAQWNPSNIRSRNGILTATVLAYPLSDELPSQLLTKVKDEIEAMDLPWGYEIAIGGEDENQRETFSEMSRVMIFSVFIIFVIMLLQFKRLNHVFIVLAAIPLCLFGASLGLLISGYPFGFTAFVGLASLIGISVRNSIILVDYANHLVINENLPIREAAIQAGQRRIRPIFLTTMAAAIGVTPMIISGSPMWAPLATVLAVGLLFAMFMTLLTIPLLYARFGSFQVPKAAGIVLVILAFLAPNDSQAQQLSLDQCFAYASKNNQDLELLKYEIQKKNLEAERINTNYLPRVNIDGGYFWYYNTARTTDVNIEINRLPIIGDTPPIGIGTELKIPEGNRFMGIANVGVYQPLTQMFKIGSGIDVKNSEVALLQEEYVAAQNKIKQGVTQLYVAISIEDTLASNLERQITLIEAQEKQINDAVKEGTLLEVYAIGLKADLLDHQTQLQEARSKRKTYFMQLNRILGFPKDTVWQAEPIVIDKLAIDELIRFALKDSTHIYNSDYRMSQLRSDMALNGISYYKNSKLPEVSFTAQGFFFEQFPLVPQTNVLVGLAVNWPILSWGKQNKDVEIARISYAQAQMQSEILAKDIAINIASKCDEIENGLLLLETAEQAMAFREEELRIQRDAFSNGLISYNDYADVQKKYLDSSSQLVKAKANIKIKEYELRTMLNQN